MGTLLHLEILECHPSHISKFFSHVSLIIYPPCTSHALCALFLLFRNPALIPILKSSDLSCSIPKPRLGSTAFTSITASAILRG